MVVECLTVINALTYHSNVNSSSVKRVIAEASDHVKLNIKYFLKASSHFVYCEKGTPFLNCRRFKCLSLNNRSTVRNSILAKSHQNSLIDQRWRQSIIVKCVSLSHAVCGCWSTLSSVSINTRIHTQSLSLSVSPLPCFLSPPFLPLYKLALRLCVYQLKYRFHCTRLFSFQR
jgi:hypothetical protein